LNDRYRGIFNERRVMMNEKDIEKAGLKEGDHVDLFNYDDGIERIAPLFIVVKYPIPQKSTMTYFPETNVLVSINNVVNGANMPASKYVPSKSANMILIFLKRLTIMSLQQPEQV
jgi:anaerobic selenocysteine-containing dehydrogenase